MSLDSQLQITTTEMHTGGEPVRIVESGYPEILGETILDKRKYARQHLDHLRKFVMSEPRGHFDMYGALLVAPDLPEADIGVVFIHNEGYGTMCGHVTMSVSRYIVDRKLMKAVRLSGEGKDTEIQVNVQCPCGLVRAFVEYNPDTQKTGRVRLHSVPAFAAAIGNRQYLL